MSLAHRIAARWGYFLATREAPAFPRWALEQAFVRLSFMDAEDSEEVQAAKQSVNIMLPKFLELLKKNQGERYYMNASQSQGRVFYYFSPKQSLDSFHLVIGSRLGRVILNLSYIPTKLDGSPDFTHAVQAIRYVEDNELAGLDLMRLARQVFSKITPSTPAS